MTVTDDRGASASTSAAVSVFPRAEITGSTELFRSDLFDQPMGDNCGSGVVTMSADATRVALETSSDGCTAPLVVRGGIALVDRSQQTVTSIAGVYPQLSRDGRSLAYASNVDNVAHVRDLATGADEVVSIGDDGTAIPTISFSLSADGRYLVFTPGQWSSGSVYVRDRLAQTTTIVATSQASYRRSGQLAISADGQIVAYPVPNAPDAVYGTTVRLLDRSTGTSATCFADLGQSCEAPYTMSADGRYLTFIGWDATVLRRDPFVFDRVARTRERVGVSTLGALSDARVCSEPAISSDGRFVAFSSEASNLVPGATARTCRAYLGIE